MVYSYLLAFLTALVVSLSMTPIVRGYAKGKGWVDNPDGKRKIHDSPVPRIGGLAIYCAFVIAFLPIFVLRTGVADYLRDNVHIFGHVLAFSGLIVLIGFWDDLRNISAWKKFAAQSLVAVLCWLAGFRILEVWSGQVSLGWTLSLFLTILWIVGITNAFNLIDGMDGLAAGAALFATLASLVVSVVLDYKLSALILFALAGSTLGFLRYNFNPASIFLGDSGSYLLGFVLAIVSLRCSQKSTTAFAIAVPVVAFGLPLLDTGLAIFRRFLKGKPIFSADRRHIHHQLISRGLKPRHAVIVLYGICGTFGLFSLFFMKPSEKTIGVVLAVLAFCVIIGVQQLRYSEFHGLKGHLSRGLQNQRSLVAGSVVVAQMLESVRKAKSVSEMLNGISDGLEEMSFSTFELEIHSSRFPFPTNGPGPKWQVISIEPGRVIYRWTSSCAECRRVLDAERFAGISSDDLFESTCARCESLRNPILQKNMWMNALSLSKSNTDYHISLPIYAEECVEIGSVRFYHPAGNVYPVPAISILSQNIAKDFGDAIQRILVVSTPQWQPKRQLRMVGA